MKIMFVISNEMGNWFAHVAQYFLKMRFLTVLELWKMTKCCVTNYNFEKRTLLKKKPFTTLYPG